MNKLKYAHTLTKEFLYQKYVIERKGSRIISKETGIDSVIIDNYLLKHSFYKTNPIQKNYDNLLTKDFLIEHYIKQVKSCQDICKEFNISHYSIVSKKLKEFDIPIHPKNTFIYKQMGHCSYNWKGIKEIYGRYIRIIIGRAKLKNIEFNLTREYLWELFEKQNKKCHFTELELTFTRSYQKNHEDQTASLDRIDSKKGYIEGNVQWVHKIINKMKSNMTDEEFKQWCYLVVNKDRKLI